MYESDTEIIDNVTKLLLLNNNGLNDNGIISTNDLTIVENKKHISKSHIYIGIIGLIICICLIATYFVLHQNTEEDDSIKDIKVHRDYFKAVNQKEKNKKIIFADLPKTNQKLPDTIHVNEKQIIFTETPKITDTPENVEPAKAPEKIVEIPKENVNFKINNNILHSADDY
jgi:hypothetical protein